MRALKVFHSHKICSNCQVIVPLLLFPIVKKKNHVIDLQYTAFLYTLVPVQLHCYRTYKTAHPIPLKRHFTNLWICLKNKKSTAYCANRICMLHTASTTTAVCAMIYMTCIILATPVQMFPQLPTAYMHDLTLEY